MSKSHIPTPPSVRLDQYNHSQLLDYLRPIHEQNKNIGFGVCQYTHGATVVASGYLSGGVYSPTQNRIYLMTSSQSAQTDWHYINCSTGTVVAYAHGISAVYGAYIGGIYSPTQNRVYLIAHTQANEANWHYIQEYSDSKVAPSLMASALFNKY